jgi:transposase
MMHGLADELSEASRKRRATESHAVPQVADGPGPLRLFVDQLKRRSNMWVRHLRNSLLAILENRQDEISPRMGGLIVGLYEDWISLDERIDTIASEIAKISEKEANCQRLMSIPGIGPLISTAVVAAIGTGEAFERGRDFGAWLGLVPRQYSTGGRSILGRISKRGSKYLRTLFIQAANVILMRPHNWERFSFGAWLLNAAPRLHRNKLATALANKLARIAWSVLRNEKAFDIDRHEVMAI